jgi:hypothetical protein
VEVKVEYDNLAELHEYCTNVMLFVQASSLECEGNIPDSSTVIVCLTHATFLSGRTVVTQQLDTCFVTFKRSLQRTQSPQNGFLTPKFAVCACLSVDFIQ